MNTEKKHRSPCFGCAVVLAVLVALASVLVGCARPGNAVGEDTSGTDTRVPLDESSLPATEAPPVTDPDGTKFGFIYSSSVGGDPLTFEMDRGRLAAAEKLGVAGEDMLVLENVADGEEFRHAASVLASHGCGCIFASAQFADDVLELAGDMEGVRFALFCHDPERGSEDPEGMAQGSADSRKDGISYCDLREYRAAYLAGVAAGMNTGSGRVGFVSGSNGSADRLCVNAFAVGVRSVRSGAKIEVRYLSAGEDESRALSDMALTGCDVIYCRRLMREAVSLAQTSGAEVICDLVAGISADETLLGRISYELADYYESVMGDLLEGLPDDAELPDYDAEKADGFAELCRFEITDHGTYDTDSAVETARERLISGETDVFAGVLRDNEGRIRVKSGASMTDGQLDRMRWYVNGVELYG